MVKYVVVFCLTILIGHVLAWLQVNGQLVWPSAKNNPLLMAALGFPISLIFIKATEWGYKGFDAQLWPVRVVGFAISTIVFGLMTWLVLGEVPTLKNWISILLCLIIILIQVFL